MANQSFKVKNNLTLTPVNLATLTNPEAGDLACDINDSNKIKQYNAGSSTWVEVGGGSLAASAVSVTPTGNLGADDVQEALVELQGDIDTLNSGKVSTASNVGTGESVFKQKTGTDLEFKKLVAGANVTLTSGTDTVTIAAAGGASGEVNTASNLGATGEGVFAQKSGVDLQFKKIAAGTNVTLTSTANTITIDAAGGASGEVNTASNVGAGSQVFKQKAGVDLQFRTLTAGSNVTLTQNTDTVTIAAAAGGETNTASNLGTGSGVFAEKVSSDLRFKSLKAGTNVTITSDATEITIASTDTGEANTASNVGAGSGVFKQKTGVDFQFKTLVAGSNVSITPGTDTITIASTDTGEVTTASNLGTGSGVFAQKVSSDLRFKSLVAGANVTLTPGADSIIIAATDTGEVNTASNLGATGEGIFAQKSGVDLQFKKIKAGTNITLTSDSESVTITAAGGGGGSAKYTRGFGIDGFATTGTNKSLPILISSNATIQSIKAYARTAPVGADLIFDINKNGTSIFSTGADRLKIAGGSNTSTVGTFTTSLAINDILELDIDQIGSTTSGKDIVIVIEVQ